MVTTAFLLLLGSAFLMLRLGTGTGSFPRPLSAAEERENIERWLAGDVEARNRLVEHNLRLVAHIIKKSEHERQNVLRRDADAGRIMQKSRYSVRFERLYIKNLNFIA